MPDAEGEIWVKLRDRLLPLKRSGVLIGRGPECDLLLDDPLVSRRHARILPAERGVVVEDLSTNGVFWQGRRIPKRCPIEGEAVLVIGGQKIELVAAGRARAFEPPTRRSEAATIQKLELPDHMLEELDRVIGAGGSADATDRTELLNVMLPAAEQLIAEGKVELAEESLKGRLREALTNARARGKLDASSAPAALRAAILLAEATRKAAWVEYPLELYGVVPEALPVETVDELYRLTHQRVSPALGVLRAYLEKLDRIESSLNPTARFALKRLHGLAKLVATR